MDQTSDDKNEHITENSATDHDRLTNKKTKTNETDKNESTQNNGKTMIRS